MNKQILVVDDEADIIDMMSMNLRAEGFTVLTAYNGATGLKKAQESRPDLILLDLGLPEMNGLEVCRVLKRDPETKSIPIIIVTAKDGRTDRVVGLELGADDYIPKPFNPREVVLRVSSILRRAGEKPVVSERYEVGVIAVDRSRYEVKVHGEVVEVTTTEFKLLCVMVQRPGHVHEREKLLVHVWGHQSEIDIRTVDTHIRRLRDKLGKAAGYIETVRGVGYRIGARD